VAGERSGLLRSLYVSPVEEKITGTAAESGEQLRARKARQKKAIPKPPSARPPVALTMREVEVKKLSEKNETAGVRRAHQGRQRT